MAGELGKPDARSRLRLGESQSYQIEKALDLYHYINPKLQGPVLIRLDFRQEHSGMTELKRKKL